MAFRSLNLAADAFAKAIKAMSYEGDQSYGINTATGLLVSTDQSLILDNPKSEKANTVTASIKSDKGRYILL